MKTIEQFQKNSGTTILERNQLKTINGGSSINSNETAMKAISAIR